MTESISLNSKSQIIKNQSSCSQILVPTVITAIALAAIGALTVGLLAHFQVLVGFNALIQWSLIGSGAFALLSTLVTTMALHCHHGNRLAPVADEHSLERVQQVFQLKDFSHINHKQFLADVDALEPKDFKDILDTFFKEECINGKDPLRLSKQVAQCVSVEALQTLVLAECSAKQSAIAVAKKMCGEAKFYLEAIHTAHPTFGAKASVCLETAFNVLDSIIAAFGVADFFKPADGSTLLADFKFQKIMMLISFFTLLTATLLPLLGVTTGASIVGGVMLLICILSVIWRHIRPMLSHLPHAENWTRQVRLKQLWTSGGRNESVQAIADALIDNRHPLLLGQSGIGKTQTVIAFIEALERGEFPKLKGKKVFYFNTADFVGSYNWFSGENDVFKRIYEAIGRHRHDCILVFDEIHLAYQSKDDTPIGEQLKTFLDDKPENSFPHVIGLTTEEEYWRYIVDNAAADRRFSTVNIRSTDAQDTLAILNKFMLQKAPEVIVEKDVLEHLIAQTEKMPQPITARRILSKCITRTKALQSPITKDVEAVRSQLELAYAQGAVLGNAMLESDDAHLNQIDLLEQQFKQLKTNDKKEKLKLQKLARSKQKLVDVKINKFQSALELKKLRDDQLNESQKLKIKEFLLTKYFLEGAVEQHVRADACALGVTTVIDKNLIDQVILEEKQIKQKRDEAIARAKKQMAERNSSSGA